MTAQHFWVRDPFKTAREFDAIDGSPLDAALKGLVARLGKPGMPLVVTPCSRPKYIIDAHPGGPCDACGCDVWIAPSSVETMKHKPVVLLCMACVEKEAGVPPWP